MAAKPTTTYSDLTALYVNCTLTKSPEHSHTELLARASMQIMEKQGVQAELIRLIDHDVPQGVYPDMTEHGYTADAWPKIYEKVKAADILVIAGPIWLGDNSSETKKLIERLYGNSKDQNDKGQFVYYGKTAGCLIDGNEDGVKHCAMNLLYSLQHLGYTIPPMADAGWLGEIGPGPSYGDDDGKGGKIGVDNGFTQRNVTFMSWNLMHTARMLKDAGGVPAYGNLPDEWAAGTRFDYANPEYR
ncbi:MAG TPA: flavodoxin family protein [Candidatus Saccharimonadales bacterium]|nr:flavodoxin family protein [Candidatus Saccharimonadales bacterium]